MSRREAIRRAVKQAKREARNDDSIEPFDDDGGRRRAARAAKLARRGASGAANRLASEFEDPPKPNESRMEALGRRAERAGQARAPVKSSLALTSDPRQIEQFASAGMTVDAGQTQPTSEPEQTGVALADPMQAQEPGTTDGAENPLHFDDPLGVTGDQPDGDSDGVSLL